MVARRGRFAARERPGWDEEVAALCATLEALAPARTLDLACGTGFLTAHLRGAVTGLDQSARMLEVARGRCPDGEFVQGDALDPPFAPGSFERVFSGHFYGHLTRRSARSSSPRRARGARAGDRRLARAGRTRRRRRGRSGCSTTARATRSTSAGSPCWSRRRAGRRRVVHAGRWFVAVSPAEVRAGAAQRAPGTRSPSAKRGGSGAPPSHAVARRSAIAGPCLKPWPEPPPTIHTRRVLRVRRGDEVRVRARSRSGSVFEPLSGASASAGKRSARVAAGQRLDLGRGRRAARRRGRAAGPPGPTRPSRRGRRRRRCRRWRGRSRPSRARSPTRGRRRRRTAPGA